MIFGKDSCVVDPVAGSGYNCEVNEAPKITISEQDLGRQAVEAMRGYIYQLYSSAQAWLSLKEDETLLIEVAEDYAVAAANAQRSTGQEYD